MLGLKKKQKRVPGRWATQNIANYIKDGVKDGAKRDAIIDYLIAVVPVWRERKTWEDIRRCYVSKVEYTFRKGETDVDYIARIAMLPINDWYESDDGIMSTYHPNTGVDPQLWCNQNQWQNGATFIGEALNYRFQRVIYPGINAMGIPHMFGANIDEEIANTPVGLWPEIMTVIREFTALVPKQIANSNMSFCAVLFEGETGNRGLFLDARNYLTSTSRFLDRSKVNKLCGGEDKDIHGQVTQYKLFMGNEIVYMATDLAELTDLERERDLTLWCNESGLQIQQIQNEELYHAHDALGKITTLRCERIVQN